MLIFISNSSGVILMDNRMLKYLKERCSSRDKTLKYDFMPMLLEIIERPTHKAGSVIVWGIFSLLAVTVVWACLSHIDVVITASGSILPEGNLKVVQAYTEGIVEKINVSEGMYVNKGDTLVELTIQSLDIEEQLIESQKKEYEIQQEIYKKIYNGDDLSNIKVKDYDEEFRTTVQMLLDSDLSFQTMIKNAEKDKSTAELNKQIAEINLEEYIENGTYRQEETQELLVEQYTLAVEQATLKIEDLSTQYRTQVNMKLAEIEQQISAFDAQLEKSRLAKQYSKLTSPVSGYVNSIDVNTVGETVGKGKQLATILPDNASVEMVCRIQNMDIADVREGMEGEIKLEAYPYSKYGTVKAKVKYISPSSFYVDKVGNIYLIKLQIEDYNKEIDLISGLSGTVEIKIDKRSIMDYFLSPIVDNLSGSLKEK